MFKMKYSFVDTMLHIRTRCCRVTRQVDLAANPDKTGLVCALQIGYVQAHGIATVLLHWDR